jgi:hypothetical protein
MPFVAGRNESVLLRAGIGGCARSKFECIGVGMRPENAFKPGELSLSGRCDGMRYGCVCVKGEGGEADPAMETLCSSIVMSMLASLRSGGPGRDMKLAGELPLLESVGVSSASGGSKTGSGSDVATWSSLKGRVCALLIDWRCSDGARSHGGSWRPWMLRCFCVYS